MLTPKFKLKTVITALIIVGFIPVSSNAGPSLFITESSLLTTLPTIEQPESLLNLRQRLEKFSNREILVKLKDDSPVSINRLEQKFNFTNLRNHFREVKSLKFSSETNLAEKLASLEADPNIEYAEPNYLAYAYSLPNDPYLQFQWSFNQNSLNLEKVWEKATGKGAVVAVVDTGVAYEKYSRYNQASDLAKTSFVPGRNFVRSGAHANDDHGHGTHVAGTIAQSTDNGEGVAGIAYNAAIMPIKVLDKNGGGPYSDVADGIVWAADNGANIINLSLGGPYPSETLKGALKYAKDKGILIVAASGNDGAGAVGYPAAYDDYVLAVGATRVDKTVAKYSNQGSSLDIVAPGGDTGVDQDGNGYGDGILQQTLSGGSTRKFGYFFFQGTSMAAPHVAATAALLVEKGVTDPDQLKSILETSADDIYARGWDRASGHGLLNPLKALQLAENSSPPISPVPEQEPNSEPAQLAPQAVEEPKQEPVESEPPAEPEQPILFVEELNVVKKGSFRIRGEALGIVVDQDGNPIRGASVSGTWAGLYSGTASRKTNSRGIAKISSRSVWSSTGEFSFTVDNISHASYEYKPENNKKSSGRAKVNNSSGFFNR